MTREIVVAHGTRGNRRILVIRDRAQRRVMVERYVHGRAKRKLFPLTADGLASAKLYARAWYTAPVAKAEAPLTLRDVWERFYEARCTVPPERGGLRPRTVALYRDRWARFELFAKGDTLAEDLTLLTFDLFWNALIATGRAPNQVRAIVTAVKVVWRWAQSRELVVNGRPLLYRCPGGEQNRPRQIPEYTPAEQARLLAQLRPQDGRQWRIAAALLFAFEHGFRSNAFLHLRWEDVDLAAGTVTMVEAWDKRHQRITRPLTYGALSALLTARYWRERLDYDGPWVFFSGQPKRRKAPWSYQAANLALAAIERAAEVPHVRGRAFHGARRTAAGNVRASTGDVVLAMHWIGDRDLKQAPKYVLERATEMQAIADRTMEP